MSFAGLKVVAFESRRAAEMAQLIRKQEGEPIIAPSMREAPIERNEEAFRFAERLLAGEKALGEAEGFFVALDWGFAHGWGDDGLAFLLADELRHFSRATAFERDDFEAGEGHGGYRRL